MLTLCDGQRSARETARLALADAGLGLRSEPDVFLALEALADQKLLVLEVELPLELHPERTLRRLLERVEVEPVRSRALSRPRPAGAGTAAVAEAASDVARLDAASDELETAFTELTGMEPSGLTARRTPGAPSSSRTPGVISTSGSGRVCSTWPSSDGGGPGSSGSMSAMGGCSSTAAT